MMTKRYDVAVIGLGAMGAAATWHLARRGVSVLGIDRFAPPHERGSSHGHSRVTRTAIGEGTAYPAFALRSHALWPEIEAATGERLFDRRGCLVLSPVTATGRGASFLETTIATAEAHGVPHEVLDDAAIAERFAPFIAPETLAGCFEPGAGALRPEACVAAQITLAEREGATLWRGVSVTGLEAITGGCRVTTSEGVVEADSVVVAAGAWAGGLLGAPFDRLLTPQRQVQHWFEVEPGAEAAWRSMPVFIRAHGDGAHFSYGMPDLDGAPLVKLGSHNDTPAADPDTGLTPATDAEIEALHRAYVAGHMRDVSTRSARTMPCFYTMTPDGHFLVDEHPDMPAVTVLAACSGHGFKHSTALGEAVAERAMGRATTHADLAPFALSRFA
jgi:sarcosine oxidase